MLAARHTATYNNNMQPFLLLISCCHDGGKRWWSLALASSLSVCVVGK